MLLPGREQVRQDRTAADRSHGFDVLTGDLEGPRMQVRHVSAYQSRGVDRRGQVPFELLPEAGHAAAQGGGMERHVDPRNVQKGCFAVLAAAQRIGQFRQRTDRARDRVLLAAQVVVDDLAQLPRVRGHVVDQALAGAVIQVRQVRADDGQSEVGGAGLIAVDQVVHGGAAGEDEFDQILELQGAGDRCQRVVLPDRMPRTDRVLVEHPGCPHLRHLGAGQGSHRYLRELGEEQHAGRMPVDRSGLTGRCGGQLGRVVAHHFQDREAQR